MNQHDIEGVIYFLEIGSIVWLGLPAVLHQVTQDGGTVVGDRWALILFAYSLDKEKRKV